MNLIRRFILIILGLLGLFGLNWFFNPSINDTDEYLQMQEEILDAELEADEIADKIQAKKDKTTEKTEKSLVDKMREEWDKE